MKSISGEDAVDLNRKGMPPLTSIKLPTRLMLLANEIPAFHDPSGALKRRLIVLRTEQSFFGNEDIHLTSKLLKELPGILNWSIEGLKRLWSRGHFSNSASLVKFVDPDASFGSSEGNEECCLSESSRHLVSLLKRCVRRDPHRASRLPASYHIDCSSAADKLTKGSSRGNGSVGKIAVRNEMQPPRRSCMPRNRPQCRRFLKAVV
jgi:hypothetical protein